MTGPVISQQNVFSMQSKINFTDISLDAAYLYAPDESHKPIGRTQRANRTPRTNMNTTRLRGEEFLDVPWRIEQCAMSDIGHLESFAWC